MNLTLLAGVAMLLAWILLLFVAAVPSGAIHLLYAGAVMLFARRVLLGAPTFRS
jgi:hypothetical protein